MADTKDILASLIKTPKVWGYKCSVKFKQLYSMS
jgi:hypothetical protein